MRSKVKVVWQDGEQQDGGEKEKKSDRIRGKVKEKKIAW